MEGELTLGAVSSGQDNGVRDDGATAAKAAAVLEGDLPRSMMVANSPPTIGAWPIPDTMLRGTEAPEERNDAPHHVALQYDGSIRCGGSIISTTVILTAGHCTEGTSAGSWRVRAGSNFHASGGDTYSVSRVVTHPSFSWSTLDYDIAVLIVSSAISIDNTNTRIIALPTSSQAIPAGASALVTGWGMTSAGGSISAQLRKVTLPVVEQTVCVNAYKNIKTITDRMVCGGLIDEGGKDACQVDSGGPFVVGGLLVGVTSWGKGCAQAGYPGVWARVPALIDWINAQK